MTELAKNIPNGWELLKIRDIALVKSGSTPSRALHDRYFAEGVLPWVKTMDLNNGHIFNTQEKITELAIQETSCPVLDEGTILVAMYGGFNQIGRTGMLKIKASINQAISALILKRDIAEPEYVLHWLNANVDLWREFAASSRKDPNITRNDVIAFPILLPPLEEQRKIAAILSTWDEGITLVEQLIAALGRRKQALMQLLLTGAVRFAGFEGEWEEVELGEIATVRRGASPRPIKDPKWFSDSGRAWIRISDVTASPTRFLNEASQYLSPLGEEKSVKIEVGELIMSIAATIGVPKIVNVPACIHDGFIVLRDFEGNATKEFLYHDLNWQTKRLANSGQPGTQMNLNSDLVRQIIVPKLDLAEQEKIASVFTECEEEIFTAGLFLDQLREQKRGLMQQLLTGAVRV